MNPEEIRERLEREIIHFNEDQRGVLQGINEHSRGHQISNATEGWLNDFLNSIEWDVESFYYLDFVKTLFEEIGRNKSEIKEILNSAWWHSIKKLIIKKKNIDEFVDGEDLTSWQQSSADLILFYGEDYLEDLEKVIFINVKGHDASRASRPPNIISGQKLMEIFKGLLEENKVGIANYWFIGIDYLINDEAEVQDIHVADLFKLDMEAIPQINFDAAIQLQWHVRDMVEKEQTRLELIENFANEFYQSWRYHSEQKSEKYKEMRDEILSLLNAREFIN